MIKRGLADVRLTLLLPLAVVAVAIAPSTATGLPHGRAWLPLDTLGLSGHSYLVPSRLELNSRGEPLLFANAQGGIGKDVGSFEWKDSAWVVKWTLGGGAGILARVFSSDTSQYLIWKGVDLVPAPQKSFAFVFTQAFESGIARPETLATVSAYSSFAYSAAVSSRNRWAAITDISNNNGRLRLFYSAAQTGSTWRETALPGFGDLGVAVTALDDSTALVIWDGNGEPMQWRVIHKDSTGEGGTIPNHELISQEPTLRRRPSGGHWLAWASGHPYVAISTYDEGAWSAPESLECDYPENVPYYTYAPDLSRDGGEYPAVAWSGFNGRTGQEIICVCVPTDSGFTRADYIRDSESGLRPTVTRDRNGDVWVAWWKYFEGAFWTHTYTTAIVMSTGVEESGGLPRLFWRLSEPAAGTWWAVLRSRADGAYEVVDRVQASPGDSTSWTDSTADFSDTLLSYRIRRECVDKRYEWLSDEVVWRRTTDAGPNPVRVGMRPPLPNPARENATVQFELSRAASVRVEVLDITGHLVRTLVKETSYPAGLHTLTWNGNDGEGRAVPSGLYFLRIRSGKESAARRLAWIR